MKKLLLIAVTCFFATGAMAQANQTNEQKQAVKENQAAPAAAKHDAQAESGELSDLDCAGMKDGKMYIHNNEKLTPMEKAISTKNGTKISTDGSFVRKDGKKGKLKNGECMDKDGKIVNYAEMKKDDKQEMKQEGDRKNNQQK